jgi:hypothetical protein
MKVMVSIVLDEDDTLSMTPDQIAEAVLTGLHGDPNKDSVMSNVQSPPSMGNAGFSGTVQEPPA